MVKQWLHYQIVMNQGVQLHHPMTPLISVNHLVRNFALFEPCSYCFFMNLSLCLEMDRKVFSYMFMLVDFVIWQIFTLFKFSTLTVSLSVEIWQIFPLSKFWTVTVSLSVELFVPRVPEKGNICHLTNICPLQIFDFDNFLVFWVVC